MTVAPASSHWPPDEPGGPRLSLTSKIALTVFGRRNGSRHRRQPKSLDIAVRCVCPGDSGLSPYLDGLTASSAPRHPPLSARLPLGLRPALPWAVMLAGRVPMAPLGVPTCRALGAGLRARATPGLRAPVVPALGLGLPRDTAPLPLGGWRPGPVRAARPPGGSSGGASARSTASRGVAGARVLPAAPSSAANLGRAVMPVPPCRRGPGPGGGCLGGSWQSSSTAVESGGAAARGVLALVWVQFTR